MNGASVSKANGDGGCGGPSQNFRPRLFWPRERLDHAQVALRVRARRPQCAAKITVYASAHHQVWVSLQPSTFILVVFRLKLSLVSMQGECKRSNFQPKQHYNALKCFQHVHLLDPLHLALLARPPLPVQPLLEALLHAARHPAHPPDRHLVDGLSDLPIVHLTYRLRQPKTPPSNVVYRSNAPVDQPSRDLMLALELVCVRKEDLDVW